MFSSDITHERSVPTFLLEFQGKEKLDEEDIDSLIEELQAFLDWRRTNHGTAVLEISP